MAGPTPRLLRNAPQPQPRTPIQDAPQP